MGMSEYRVALEEDRGAADFESVHDRSQRFSDPISVIVLDLVVTALAMPLVLILPACAGWRSR